MSGEAMRNPVFVSLIQRATAALDVARELKERAASAADAVIGPVIPGPQPGMAATNAPRPHDVAGQLGDLIDAIHSQIGEAQEHVYRILRELPPVPEAVTAPTRLGR